MKSFPAGIRKKRAGIRVHTGSSVIDVLRRANRKWPRCGNCKKPGHTVAECVHPAADGFVHGCPVCNRGTHNKSEHCHRQWPNEYFTLKMAITRRGNRPPLAAFANWADLLRKAYEGGHIRLPGIFPWTPTYCRSLFENHEGPYLWETFDYNNNRSSGIGADPRTASFEALKLNFSDVAEENKTVSPITSRCWTPKKEWY